MDHPGKMNPVGRSPACEAARAEREQAMVAVATEHRRQKRELGRREVFSRAHTSWGASQGATLYGEGVVCHSTASHGGFHLDSERNGRVHALLRAADGFYEEDCHWAAVAQAFPDLFTDSEKRCAAETLRHWYPDAWETIHGRVLGSGESREKDREIFGHKHAGDWVAISALTLQYEPGFVEVIATLGGQRAEGARKRRFLVPERAYCPGPFGHVVDETRDRAYDGPSGFVGWRGEHAP